MALIHFWTLVVMMQACKIKLIFVFQVWNNSKAGKAPVCSWYCINTKHKLLHHCQFGVITTAYCDIGAL